MLAGKRVVQLDLSGVVAGTRYRGDFEERMKRIIDEVRDQLRQITELLLEETRRKLRAQDLTVEFTPQAVDWIAGHGYQPQFGARPMRRTIQREVDNSLPRLILDGRISPGSRSRWAWRDGRLTFDTAAGQPAAAR